MAITTVPDARRHAIGSALLRVVARDGLDGVSLRAVAAEAATSLGMVQRQFATKDEMLLFALRLSGEMTGERIRRVPFRGPVLSTLRRIVDELLPLDEQRITEARVYHAFVAKAATRADFADVVEKQDRGFQEILVSVFATAETEGEIAPGHDHAALARLFSSVLDGTSAAMLARPPGAPTADITAGLDELLRILQLPEPT
ncbi:TetR/AcrR family transcriptional regulator [Pseudonocardia sp. TRM90224]|uniref:TetR/AcrR family transcriptional regulator n=1 Tax=Pseudonocardia sp. TRM90224 TaxID=2812678 RepID=UPI001E28346F|nr:TetR family transcriptional regulator C-terminal domain-containing protein [Pseudonocardia sp. TRM90224]